MMSEVYEEETKEGKTKWRETGEQVQGGVDKIGGFGGEEVIEGCEDTVVNRAEHVQVDAGFAVRLRAAA